MIKSGLWELGNVCARGNTLTKNLAVLHVPNDVPSIGGQRQSTRGRGRCDREYRTGQWTACENSRIDSLVKNAGCLALKPTAA